MEKKARLVSQFFLIAVVVGGALPAVADHEEACVPGGAGAQTYTVIALPDGTRYYVEERDSGVNPGFALPGSGFATGYATFIYREQNGVEGLQRGGHGTPACVPNADLCVIVNADNGDESCGHGSDWLVAGILGPPHWME